MRVAMSSGAWSAATRKLKTSSPPGSTPLITQPLTRAASRSSVVITGSRSASAGARYSVGSTLVARICAFIVGLLLGQRLPPLQLRRGAVGLVRRSRWQTPDGSVAQHAGARPLPRWELAYEAAVVAARAGCWSAPARRRWHTPDSDTAPTRAGAALLGAAHWRGRGARRSRALGVAQPGSARAHRRRAHRVRRLRDAGCPRLPG